MQVRGRTVAASNRVYFRTMEIVSSLERAESTSVSMMIYLIDEIICVFHMPSLQLSTDATRYITNFCHAWPQEDCAVELATEPPSVHLRWQVATIKMNRLGEKTNHE